MVTHPIPGNGYVPPSKILVAGLAAVAVVTAVFSVQKGGSFVPHTINRVRNLANRACWREASPM